MKAIGDQKYCPSCGLTKHVSEYTRNSTRGDGLSGYCRPCHRAASDRWREANKDHVTEYLRRRVRTVPEHLKAVRVDSRRRRAYGIEPSDYQQLLESQGGKCALCLGDDPRGHALAVDHDHACCGPRRACRKCVRGLLCNNCNRYWLPIAEANPRLQNDVSRDYLRRRPLA